MWKELRQGLSWEIDFGYFSVSIQNWGSEYGAYMDGDTFIGKSESLDGAKSLANQAIRKLLSELEDAATTVTRYLAAIETA